MRTSLRLEVPADRRNNPANYAATRRPRSIINDILTLVGAVIGGGLISRGTSGTRPSVTVPNALAYGIVTMNAPNAADTFSINGQAFTAVAGAPSGDQFDQSGTNAQDARSLVTAINATATVLVSDHVKAACRTATVTLATVSEGDTVEVDGIRFKAVQQSSGLRVDEFRMSGTDTQDATSLAAQINAHPQLRERVVATSSGAVVTVRELPPEPSAAVRVSSSNGTRLAVSTAVCADSADVLVAARYAGVEGNAVAIASSNGTRLPITGSAARLTGGTSTTTTF